MSDEKQQQQDAQEADAKETQPSQNVSPKDFSVFTTNEKRAIVLMGSLAGFFSPLSSSIYFPALDTIASSLKVSITKINLTVTTYLVHIIKKEVLSQITNVPSFFKELRLC
jgi:uncharacterized membrane protein